jgi:hypothetical protein
LSAWQGKTGAAYRNIELALEAHVDARRQGGQEAQNEELTVLDTTPVVTAIARLISTGTPERQLLAAVAHDFPELTPAELSVALQEATTAAEAARRH